jgi:electron transfer flavoprotein alpha subunit
MGMGKRGPILVFIEQRSRCIRRSSLEVLSEGYRISQKLSVELLGVIIGFDIHDVAQDLGEYGVKRVFIVDEERFKLYSPEGYARALLEVSKRINPSVILLAASSMGKDLAPTVGAIFGKSILSDCTEIILEDEKLLFKRPIYAAKAYMVVSSKKEPIIATLRPNVFRMEKAGTGRCDIEALSLTLQPSQLRSVVKEIVEVSAGKVDLTEAQIIISGGRGMKSAENFQILEELAELLGAAVGASRAAVDAGWRPQRDQVGQTGKTVSPNLYIACGISGAIQHLAGMGSSKVIVAINKDPDAPIFKVANYGILGDLFEVVPAMTEQLRKIL